MNIVERLKDLVGCTVAYAGDGHVVFWTGNRTLLQFKEVEGALIEAGSYTSSRPLGSILEAQAMAARVSYR